MTNINIFTAIRNLTNSWHAFLAKFGFGPTLSFFYIFRGNRPHIDLSYSLGRDIGHS